VTTSALHAAMERFGYGESTRLLRWLTEDLDEVRDRLGKAALMEFLREYVETLGGEA
jgi:hypothetical protein